jgi:small-conductance mechanosensitive channel
MPPFVGAARINGEGGAPRPAASTRRCLRVLVLLSALSQLSLPSLAALPVLSNAAPAVSGTAAEGGGELTREATRALLEAARRESAVPAPAGADGEEIKQRGFYLHEIIRTYERHLVNLARIESLRAELRHVEQESENWKAFDTPPPYPVPFVDALLHDEEAIEKKHKLLTDRIELLADFREQLTTIMRKSASDQRLAEERLQHGDSGANSWAMELSGLRLRVQTALLQSASANEEINRVELAIANAEAAFARRKTRAAQKNVDFPESDFRKINSDLDAESRRVTSSLASAQDAASAAGAEREKTQEAVTSSLARHITGDAPTTRAAQKALEDRSKIAQLRAETAELVLDALRFQPIIVELKRKAWDYRYQLRQKAGAEVVAEAKLHYQRSARALGLFERSAQRQLTLVASETDRLESQLETPDPMIDRADLRRRLNALTDREEKLRSAYVFLASTQEVVRRLGDELDVRSEGQSGREYFRDIGRTTLAVIAGVWNYELFVAEDTIEVAGKKVTGTTSVTLGKVLRALTLLAVGIVVTTGLGRFAEKVAVQRFKQDHAHARIMRKWMSAVGVLALVIIVLFWVNIPLSVFAFLGGTIAIGVGFGMQNLLKNLISGLMLLFERPFRPGDQIEVGSLAGVVTEVGIRASTIHHANGIDTLVPNSTFLEQNVTNWMYENRKARFSIEVGVAYGSPVKEVERLLLEAMNRHALVLREPEPEVMFQRFGPDALEFGLYFWVSINDKVNARRVASDLHYIIEKSLGEHGVVIACPQRDVHLDAPLKVEVVGAPAQDAEATPRRAAARREKNEAGAISAGGRQ